MRRASMYAPGQVRHPRLSDEAHEPTCPQCVQQSQPSLRIVAYAHSIAHSFSTGPPCDPAHQAVPRAHRPGAQSNALGRWQRPRQELRLAFGHHVRCRHCRRLVPRPRRHWCTSLSFSLNERAIADTEAPGSAHIARISASNCSLCRRTASGWHAHQTLMDSIVHVQYWS